MRTTIGAPSIDCAFSLANPEFSRFLVSHGLIIEILLERQEIVVNQDRCPFALSLAHRKIHPSARREFEDSLLNLVLLVFLGWLQEIKIPCHCSFFAPFTRTRNLILPR
jgi:hypothetical protein